MKKIFTLFSALLLCLTFSLRAQLLVEEFNYTAGTTLTANGWNAHSAAGNNSMTVGAASLTFPTYSAAGFGGSGISAGNGEDINSLFTTVSQGSTYASFLVKVDTVGTANYFFHFGENPMGTIFRARVFVKEDATLTNAVNFGLSVGSGTQVTYDATAYPKGSTLLIVIKYTIISGTTNDEVSLFVFDQNATSIATEPTTPNVGPLTDALFSDINPGSVGLRQFSASTDLTVDAIRVDTVWNLTPNAPTLTFTSITPATNQCTASARTVSVNITPNTGSTSSAVLNYSFDGVAQTPISMTNTSGTTWEGTISAATPVNADVSWNVVATNAVGLTDTYTGTNYTDEPLFGLPLGITASANAICSGTSATLSAEVSGDVTIGLGANTGGGSTSYLSPFNHFYGGFKAQYIFLASELTANGMSSGNINSLALNVTTAGTSYADFAMNIGATTQSAATTTMITSGLTPVYSVASTTPTVGLNTYPFSSSFYWDGVSNIVVQICWSNNNGGGSTALIKYDATPFTSVTYYRADYATSSSICGTTSGTGTKSERPQIVFNATKNAGYTFSWSDGTSTIGTGATLTASPLSNTSYTFTATNQDGCSVTSPSETISLLALPAAPTATNSTQCGTQIPTASVSGSTGTFNWYDAATGGNLIQSSAATALTSAVSATDTFYVSEFDGTCESAPLTEVIVTVTASPSITVSATPATICEGQSASIDITSTLATYDYSIMPGALTGASNTVSPMATTTYNVTATDNTVGPTFGCSTVGSVTVNVNANPVINSATVSENTVCEGAEITLNAAAVGSYAFTEPFETATLSTFTSGGSGGTFAQNTTYFIEGSSSWRINTGNSANAWLESNTIDLSNLTAATLSFQQICGSESGWDYGYIQYSLDNGATWTSFPTSSYLGAGTLKNGVVSFDKSSYSDWNSTFTGSGSTPSTAASLWKLERINLAALTGNSQVKIRFRLTSDSGGNYYGWLLDDVKISDDVVTYAWASTPAGFSATTATATANPTSATDYTLTASNAAGCTTTSATLSVATLVLPSAPTAANSTQCGLAIPTASVASTAGTAGTGSYNWFDAATAGNLLQGQAFGALSPYYTNDFSSSTLTNASITGSANVTVGGVLEITPNSTSQAGSFTVNASGVNSNKYSMAFDLITTGTVGNMADGVSFSFGDDVNATATAPNAENGTGTKLKVGFVAYTNGGSTSGIYLMYNCTTDEQTPSTSGVLAYSNNNTWMNATAAVVITIDSLGKVNLSLNGSPLFTDIQLPASYLNEDRSNWSYVFKGRTGGISMGAALDNVNLQYGAPIAGYTSFNAPVSTTTDFYVSEIGTNGCESARTMVTATVTTPPTISAAATQTSICEGESTTITVTSSNPDYTYTWMPGTLSGTSNTLSPASTTTYTITAEDNTTGANAGCATAATLTITVNEVPANLAASVNNSTVCATDEITLTATVNPTSTATSLLENFENAGAISFTQTSTAGTISQNSTYFSEGANSIRIAYASSNTITYESGLIDLSNINAALLTFKQICATESGWDYGYVQYSTDNGQTWTSFPTSSYQGTGTLKNGVVSFDKSSYGNWNSQFSSSSSTPGAGPATALWQLETINLSAFVGNSQFKIRFRLTSDTSANYYGWMIDDINLIDQSVAFAWTSLPVGYTASGATATDNPTASADYTVVATGLNGCSSTAPAVSVTVNPIYTTPTVAAATVNYCTGNTPTQLAATTTATGVFVWYEGTNTGSLTAPTPSAATAGTTTYFLVDSNTTTGCKSAAAQVDVNVFDPISVVTQPMTQTVCTSDTLTLEVVTAPGANISYQWKKGSTTLNGETASTLVIANVATTDAGDYSVDITSDCGTISSATATVTVNETVSFTAQPQAVSTCVGTTATFTAAATGTGTITYQWFKGTNSLNGETAATLTLAAVTTADGGDYSVEATGDCGTVSSAVATLTIDEPVVITTQPLGDTICEGTALNFSVAATGAGLTYQWRKNTIDINNATSDTYTVASAATTDNGTYSVVVTGTCSSETSADAVVAVNPNLTASVTLSASSTSVCGVDPITFTANPTNGGTAPVYAWYLNNAIVQGETSSTLTLATPAANDEVYVELTSNATACLANTTAISTTLTLGNSTNTPTVSIVASATTICDGTSVTFTATGSSTGTAPTYQWMVNSTAVGTAGSDNTFTSATLADGDVIEVEMTSNASCTSTPTAMSNAITMVVTPVTAITTQPMDITACEGTAAQLDVVATGTGTLAYQWKQGTTNVGTGATLSFAALALSDAGTYTVDVVGTCGTVTSTAVTVTVNPLTTISTQPATQAVCIGSPVTLSVAASGAGTLAYQWYNGTTLLTNETAATLSIAAATSNDAGSYTVEIVGGCNTVTSAAAVLTVNDLTAITTQPVGFTQCQGTAASISVTGTGAGTLTYQWYNGSTAINTTDAINFTALALSDAGSYTVDVTGTCGTVTSSAVTIAVDPLTAITTQPLGGAICEGGNGALSVAATGSGTLSYQWYVGTTLIPGATADNLPVTNIALINAGDYTVQVTGGCNTVTSAIATVVVNPLPIATLTSGLTANTACAGDNIIFTAGGGASYDFTLNTASVQSGTNASYSSMTFANNDVVGVTVTTAAGCSATATPVTLTINALPTVAATSNVAAICVGDTAQFTATGAATYTWLPANDLSAATSATTAAYPTATNTYTVVGIDANGCENFTTLALTVNNNPVISFSPIAPVICAGDTASITANGANTYVWTTAPSLVATNNGNITANPTASSLYTVIGTTTATGCNTTATVNLVVNQLPTFDLGAGPAICAGSTSQFCAPTAVSYAWSNGSTTQCITTGLAGTYTVTITDANGCKANDNIGLTVNANPVISLGNDTAFCIGNTLTLSGGTFTGYNWNTGGATQTIDVIASGAYSLTVTDANGCVGNDLILVTVNQLPQPNLGDDQTMCGVASIQLTAGATFATYLWSTGATSNPVTITNQQIVEGVNVVWVEVTNGFGCSNTDTLLLTGGCVGIEELSTSASMFIYPNPTSADLNIQLSNLNENEGVVLQVVAMTGEYVAIERFQFEGSEMTKTIDMSKYASGVYFVNIINGKNIMNQRFIVH